MTLFLTIMAALFVLCLFVIWQTLQREKLREQRTVLDVKRIGLLDYTITWRNGLGQEFTIRGASVHWLHVPNGEEASHNTKMWACNQIEVYHWKVKR